MSDKVNERAVLSVFKADRQGALDLMKFNRIPHVNRIKYEDGFVPPKDHNEWVERQVSRGKSGKPPSVRSTVRDALEELTEERALFEKLDGRVKSDIVNKE